MRIMIVHGVGSVYALEGGELLTAPLNHDNTFDTDDLSPVEEDLIGSEPLTEPYQHARTFSELYARLKWELGQ